MCKLLKKTVFIEIFIQKSLSSDYFLQDLILLVTDLQSDLDSQKKKLKDLEDYLDDLLLRVMETTPRILQNPYVTCKFSQI